MRLNCVEGDEQLLGNLTIGEALSDEFEYLVLALADAITIEKRGIKLELRPHNDYFLPCQAQSRPNTKSGEQECNKTEGNLSRKVSEEVAVLNELESRNQRGHTQTVRKNNPQGLHCR